MKLARAGILTIGDELLGGRTINTNAAYLAQGLTDAGFLVVAMDTVGDDEFGIVDAIKGLVARADTVVVSGGLGPTPDDVTREALAGAAGSPLVVDRALRKEIAEKTGGRAPRRNARMARVPAGARVFRNPVGTAAGLRVSVGGTPVYALPGVPLELEAIFPEAVLRDLDEVFIDTEPVPSRVLRVFGLREAEVADRLGDLLERDKDPVVGVTVRDGIITITVSGDGTDRRAAEIRALLGRHFFAEGADRTLAHVVLEALDARDLTLATAESVTGGLVSSLLIDVPGASRVLRGGLVAYAAETKHALLGVPKTVLKREGSVSAETTLRMARGVRKRLDAQVGLATTGVAGPDPDERGTPVGRAFVAVVDGRGEKVKKITARGVRNAIRRRVAWAALDLLRRRL